MLRLKVKGVTNQKGFSMNKLSQRSEISCHIMRDIYRGPFKSINTDTLNRSAKALGVPVTEIIENVPEEEQVKAISQVDACKGTLASIVHGEEQSDRVQNPEFFYVLGDGNHIRENVESYLLNHDLETLSKFSQSLTTAINELKEIAISSMNAQVILAGGDDILLSVPREKYRKELIQELQQAFLARTGTTISFGVGHTVEAAYINLRRAKTRKDDKIVEEEDKK